MKQLLQKIKADKFIQKFTDNKVDKRAYKKFSKAFTKKLNFFKPQLSNSELIIKDGIFNKEFKVPHNWLYIQSNQKVENMPDQLLLCITCQQLGKDGEGVYRF